MESGPDPSDPTEHSPTGESQPPLILNGRSRMDIHLDLAPGAEVEITVEARTPEGELLERRELHFRNPGGAPALPQIEPLPSGQQLPDGRKPPRPVLGPVPAQAPFRVPGLNRARAALARMAARAPAEWQTWLFGGALAVYLITRLIGLAGFPIYFFTDEAVQTVLAADLVRDGFHGYSKELLPTFFPNGNQYNLSTSVYLQVLPYMLFDKSVWVTRGVAVLMTLIAAFAVGKILKEIYHSPHPWVAVLVLSITPVWFLHSRTAFETALATSFYAGFLYYYMKYRCISPRYLYGAVAFGGLAFYTYSPMQLIMLLSAVLLLISDARYHWQQRATLLRGFGLVILLALPYARYLYDHPTENIKHLQILSSYWTQDLTLSEKLGRFFNQYGRGLNPAYWYFPNNIDLARHRMGNYGHLLRWLLPFAAVGLYQVVKNLRSSPNRAVLVALIVAPSGAAMVELGATRALVMVVPAALLASIGLIAVLGWLERFRLPRAAPALALFGVLTVFNFYLMDDSLTHGPTWYSDYGLGGMQYGAQQLSAALREEVMANPGEKIIVSPSWSNGTNVVFRFFFNDPAPFDLGTIDNYMNDKLPLDDNTLFVMIPEELKQAAASSKFQDIHLEKILPYPNGQPGFYFVRLRYSAAFDAMVRAEQISRRAMKQASVPWNGELVQVRYSTLDMGQIKDALDGNDQTLIRTLEANPLKLDISLPQTQTMQGLKLRIGGAPQRVTLHIYQAGSTVPLNFSETVEQNPDPRMVSFPFHQGLKVERIVIEVKSIFDQEPAHVHLWEVRSW